MNYDNLCNGSFVISIEEFVMKDGIYSLLTHHGTSVFWDEVHLRLRHAAPAEAYNNLFLRVNNGKCVLIWARTAERGCTELRFIDSEGHMEEASDSCGSATDVEIRGSQRITINCGGMFLSADSDGVVRINRGWAREWEEYWAVTEPACMTCTDLVSATGRLGQRERSKLHSSHSSRPRRKISGFVVTYNRENILEACLSSIRFVDELIVIDKSSTDGSIQIAKRFADRLFVLPWSPSADDTRSHALSLCSNDFIVFLDDDECLSPAAVDYIISESYGPSADVYSIPFRSYYLGHFDERRRDWPEYHERFFVRGALEFPSKIHSNVEIKSNKRHWIPAESDIFVYHFSYASVAQWIEKANRYTSQPDRDSWFPTSSTPSEDFVIKRLEYWAGPLRGCADDYVTAYALMRLTYDLIDLLKRWEEKRAVNAERVFLDICKALVEQYARPNR